MHIDNIVNTPFTNKNTALNRIVQSQYSKDVIAKILILNVTIFGGP